MDSTPTPPILLDMGGDIEVYEDVEAACAYLEVYDLPDTSAFDVRGYQLKISSEGYQVTGMEIAPGPPNPEHVTRKLQDFVRQVGPDRVGIAEPSSASLEQLMTALIRFRNGPAR